MVGMPAEPQLGERARVRSVFEGDGETGRRFDPRTEIDGSPAQVRREHEPARCIDTTRQADAETFAQQARMRGAERLHRAREFVHEGVGIGVRRPRRLLDETRVNAGQADGGALGPDFDGHETGADAAPQNMYDRRPRTVGDAQNLKSSCLEQIRRDSEQGHAGPQHRVPRRRRSRAALSPRCRQLGHAPVKELRGFQLCRSRPVSARPSASRSGPRRCR